jgi:hypothetical protein
MKTITFFSTVLSALFFYNLSFASTLKVEIQKSDITCFGQKNGKAIANISGGEAPYQLQWNNGATASELIDLGKGTYSLMVTDAKGSVVSETVEINMPEPISVTFNAKSLLFSEALQADLNINVKGGTPAVNDEAYTLKLEDNTNILQTSALESGLYKLSITDGNGCKLAFKTNLAVQEMGESQISLNNTNNGFGVIEITWKPNDISANHMSSLNRDMK